VIVTRGSAALPTVNRRGTDLDLQFILPVQVYPCKL